MARTATKWAYKTKPAELCPEMTPPALAVLRALCWMVDPITRCTKTPVSDRHLMRLTGYRTRAKIVEARWLLRKHGLIGYDFVSEDAGKCFYCVRFKLSKWEED